MKYDSFNVRPSLPVFVYGTLMSGQSNAYTMTRACKSSPSIQVGTLPGFIMYDLGPYPVIVAGDGQITGEVVSNVQMLDLLDSLEGHPHLYERQKHTATVSDGRKVEVWVYAAGDTMAKRAQFADAIPSGDWRNR